MWVICFVRVVRLLSILNNQVISLVGEGDSCGFRGSADSAPTSSSAGGRY